MMDAAAAASINALVFPTTAIMTRTTASNFLRQTPFTTRLTTLAQLTSNRRSSDNSGSFLFQQRDPSKAVPKNGTLFLTHCSMRPGVNSDSATSRNPATELNPDSTSQPQADPTPNRALLPSKRCRGLVLDLGSECSWDGAEVGSPVVKRFIGDDEERWYMWYHGRSDGDSTDSIGLAASRNGIHWARGAGAVRSSGDVGLVMECSSNWWAFDTHSIRPSEMVIMSSPMYSSLYWLYYSGGTEEEVVLPPDLPIENPKTSTASSDQDQAQNYGIGKTYKSHPGLACSQDGRNWARIEGDQHSGALLEVGTEGEWDSLFIGSPQVVMHCSNDLRMYYHSYDVENRQLAIGIARSRDGIRWVKLGKIMAGGGRKGCFDELGVMNAHVIRNRKDDKYLMAYEGVSADGTRNIGLAVSEDGLKNWSRIQDDPVLLPSEEGGWDSKGVGSPCLVQMEDKSGEFRLYYRGIGKEGRTGIGMAIADGSSMGIFRRWEGFYYL